MNQPRRQNGLFYQNTSHRVYYRKSGYNHYLTAAKQRPVQQAESKSLNMDNSGKDVTESRIFITQAWCSCSK
jgi:hypothetical protein